MVWTHAKTEAGNSEGAVVSGSLFSSLPGSRSYIPCIFQVHSSLNNTSSMLATNVLWNKVLETSSSSDPILLSLCSFLSYVVGLLTFLIISPLNFSALFPSSSLFLHILSLPEFPLYSIPLHIYSIQNIQQQWEYIPIKNNNNRNSYLEILSYLQMLYIRKKL